MNFDHGFQRDHRLGNNGVQYSESGAAGVSETDSYETAFRKIEDYRKSTGVNTPLPELGNPFQTPAGFSGSHDFRGASAGLSGKAVAWIVGLLLLLPILQFAWSSKDALFVYVDQFRRERAGAERIEEFSDFSKLSDWPKRVQAIHQKGEDKSLERLLDEIPADLRKLPPAKREMLGAQIWFKLSSKGAGATDYLATVQEKPNRVKYPKLAAASLSLGFLKNECSKGVELACLDGAKSFAALVWFGRESSQDPWMIDSALGHLPTSGPLAKSEAIASLRSRISAIPVARVR